MRVVADGTSRLSFLDTDSPELVIKSPQITFGLGPWHYYGQMANDQARLRVKTPTRTGLAFPRGVLVGWVARMEMQGGGLLKTVSVRPAAAAALPPRPAHELSPPPPNARPAVPRRLGR